MILDALAKILPEEALDTRIVGKRTLPVARPGSEEQWIETLRLASSSRWRVHPIGGGTNGQRIPESADLLLSSSGCAAVLAFEPGDGTLTAQAGATMGSLASLVEGSGYHLTPDVPHPQRATLGGAVSAGSGGFDRLRYGPMRHVLLGVDVLLADGTPTRSGGRLVKNVTGYDLHRLYCGSRGRLAVILSASLRLIPLPRRRIALRSSFGKPSDALAAATVLRRSAIRPEALFLEGSTLSLFLGGREEVLAFERELAAPHLPSAEVLEDEAVRAHWCACRDAPSPSVCIELTCRPSLLAGVLARIESGALERGLQTDVRAHPAVASARVGFERRVETPSPRALDLALRTLTAELEPALQKEGVSFRWSGFSSAPPAPTSAPEVLRLEQALAHALDPDGIFAGGADARD